MPVVRCGDHDGVDVFAIENRAEILDAGDVALEFGHLGNPPTQTGEPRVEPIVGRVEIGLIHIAQGDDLGIGLGDETLQKLAAAIAHADEAKPNLVVGSQHAARSQAHGGRGRGRGRDGRLGKAYDD